MLYDKTDKQSILTFARRLEGSSIIERIDKDEVDSDALTNKGAFGNILEREYFKIPNNNKSRPDFEEAGLELKASPLKKLKNGNLVAKERIVLGLINYMNILDENFWTSHLVYKNKEILIIFYLHEKGKPTVEMEVKLVDIWRMLEEDADIIQEDWEYIVNRIREGKAHLISEGDTYYLGACTKGSTAATSWVPQPNSTKPAKRRAFAFKQSYVNHIIKEMLSRKTSRKNVRKRRLTQEKPKGVSFENFLKSKFSPFFGKSEIEIKEALGLSYAPSSKSKYALLTKAILGRAQNEELDEFMKAGIITRTIRIEPNGSCKEHLSFKQIRYMDIIDEEWEDSIFYEEITRKFFFIIFRKEQKDDEYRLHDVRFWNMPEDDIDTVRLVWEDTRDKIRAGDYVHFIKSSDNLISHVRPKGRDSDDLMKTPQGTLEKKKCFWLNRSYILKNIYKDRKE